jgi:hypothetical protein
MLLVNVHGCRIMEKQKETSWEQKGWRYGGEQEGAGGKGSTETHLAKGDRHMGTLGIY